MKQDPKGLNPVAALAARLDEAERPPITVPRATLLEFLGQHARVRCRDGAYRAFGFEGRRPLAFAAQLIAAIVRNTRHGERVEIDGVGYAPGTLKGATVALCGGAQFGKTVLELNVIGWATTVELLNAGYYTSDQELLATIVDTKFRPDVVDQIPWMASMVQLNKSEGKSGRTVDRKNAFQVSDGTRKAFGYFNGMQKPPTTISLDIAVLDEVDDIPERNIGFVAGRMTNSDVQLTCFIGTQRVHAAGQNARWQAGTMHRWLTRCPGCGAEHALEEQWPRCCRVAVDGRPAATDPVLAETMQFDPDARYYAACVDCGAALDPDAGRFAPEHGERARQRNWSIRVAQVDIPAIAWGDVVASWFAALADPNPDAMVAWHCDRRAIPHAGAAQPITPEVLARARACGLAETAGADSDGVNSTAGVAPYSMSLSRQAFPRYAGMDMGPRCWLWVNERRSAMVSALSWAELVPSGTAYERLLALYGLGAFECVFLDAGGEPDLTKRIVLGLNGLDAYAPPVVPITELRGMTLQGIGAGVTWDGQRGRWRGIRAAAVAFSLREAGGVQHDIGVTQEGRIYPLLKAQRWESIQGAVNDLLGPGEGVVQQVTVDGRAVLRTLPRQRLPRTCIGPGVTDALLDGHLLNLRRVRDARTGREDWADGVQNHLGLAACYARLAEVVGDAPAGGQAEASGVVMGGDGRGGRRDRILAGDRRAVLI